MAIVTLQAKLYQAFHCLVVDKNTGANLTATSSISSPGGRALGAKARIRAKFSLSVTMRYATKGGDIKGDNGIMMESSLRLIFPTYLRIDINKLSLPEGITVNLYVDDGFVQETRRTPYTNEKYPEQLLNPLPRTSTFTFKVPKEFKFARNAAFSILANNVRPRPFSAALSGAMNFVLNGNYSPAKGVTLVVSPFTQITNAIKTFRPVLSFNSVSTVASTPGFLKQSGSTMNLSAVMGNIINYRLKLFAVDPIQAAATTSISAIRNIGPIIANINSVSSVTCAGTVIRDFAGAIAPAATSSLSAQAQDVMVIRYSGVAGTVTLPFDPARNFSLYVDWGDGQITYHENESGLISHTYVVPLGQTDVTVWGQAEKMGYYESWLLPGMTNVIEFKSWDSIGLENLEYSCAVLPNLQNVPEKLPSTIEATGIRYMFFNNQTFNGDNVEHWGSSVNRITDLSYVFYNARAFNQSLGGWDVSNVSTTNSMFYDARNFNQNLSAWNTGNIRFMNYMFYSAREFNQPIGNWNTSKVVNFNFMFFEARKFNQYIGNWDVTGEPILGAPNVNMQYMFSGAIAFNQQLTNWDVSNVWNTVGMFSGATAYNQAMPSWNLSLVTTANAAFMFNNATSFNQDLSTWCVPLITSAPTSFDTGATAWTNNRPQWGQCPALDADYVRMVLPLNSTTQFTDIDSGTSYTGGSQFSITTTNPKFYGSCAVSTTPGNHLKYALSGLTTSGNFCIEFWARTDSSNTNNWIFGDGTGAQETAISISTFGSTVDGGGNTIRLITNPSTSQLLAYKSGDGAAGRIGGLTANTWYHFAFTKAGWFVNGVYKGTMVWATNHTWSAFNLGGQDETQGGSFVGAIQDVRIYTGINKYSNGVNFTPPGQLG